MTPSNATQEPPLTLQPLTLQPMLRQLPRPASQPVAQAVAQPAPQPAPRQAAPHQAAPRQAAPHQAAPHQAAPHQAAPHQAAHQAPHPPAHAVQPQASRGRPAQPHRLPRWLRRAARAWGRWARAWTSPRRPRSRYAWTLVAELPELVDEVNLLADRRCGWFDSSQDLREGLAVSEHEAADAVCAQLPVMDWVRLQLAGWRPHLDGGEPALA